MRTFASALLLVALAPGCAPASEPPAPPEAPAASLPGPLAQLPERFTSDELRAEVERADLGYTARRIATDAQAWALKPAEFGGGGGSFAGLTLADLSYPADDDGAYRTHHYDSEQVYRLAAAPDSVVVTATSPTASGGVTAVATGFSAGEIQLTPPLP